MRKKLIKFIALNILILINFQLSFADNLILPKKKPDLSKEILEKKISKNLIFPKKKPTLDKEEKNVETSKSEIKKITKIDGIIIPKNKPLIVRKQTTRVAKKSSYYSDRDYSYAKQSIQFMEKSNWKDALKVAKKARAKSIYNFIQWRHLLTTGNNASFYDYKQFIELNGDYPRINRIKYLGEHKISTKVLSNKKLLNGLTLIHH